MRRILVMLVLMMAPVMDRAAWAQAGRELVLEGTAQLGAGTHPGAGSPGVVGSAKATAKLMLEDLA